MWCSRLTACPAVVHVSCRLRAGHADSRSTRRQAGVPSAGIYAYMPIVPTAVNGLKFVVVMGSDINGRPAADHHSLTLVGMATSAPADGQEAPAG
jgi:hypothetical protein